MRSSVKATIITAGIAVVLVLAVLAFLLVQQSGSRTDAGTAEVARQNSHVLDDAGADAVQIVEFLDFECEACGAFYPIVEDLREQYAGQITYTVRYFPLPGHANSTNAAVAAEAAAQQGRFEDMYHRLFETQSQWGESRESRAELFRGYAQELGLDMTTYDQAVADPETQARVTFDLEEGKALGVHSTPTFFIDGARLDLQRWDDLARAVERSNH